MAVRISLLLPTRERPALVQRYLQSLVDHTDRLEDVEVILYVDEDDPESHTLGHDQVCIHRLIGPRATMGAFNTACFQRSSGDIVVLQNDDMIIRTPGWDTRVRAFHETVADGIYLAYPNELFVGGNWCTIPILSRTTCELLGDPFPAHYLGGFIDYHLSDIFERLKQAGHDRLYYLDDVVIEHLHYRFGKSEYDATYRFRGHLDAGDEIFIALRGFRCGVARRLAAAIEKSPLPEVPALGPIGPRPRGIARATADYLKTFLLDSGLPWKWRWHLFRMFLRRFLLKTFKYVTPPAVETAGLKKSPLEENRVADP
ncbi:MAG: glycosyltransferase family 2 protein [Nitrospinaceae bacterium]|nr:glycosyltransferase family 2 protein [Nitrospinaceae bacterium]NIU97195.1 hypothetical protein [Nitrospinaceae bacterium]